MRRENEEDKNQNLVKAYSLQQDKPRLSVVKM